MPYVRVPDPLLDVNKPGRSVDWKQIRDNQDYFDAQITAAGLGIRTDQDIREQFVGTTINTNVWTEMTTATSLANRHYALFVGTASASGLGAATERLRIMKSEEYVAFCEARVKIDGAATNDGYYAFGWNDNALAIGTLLSDHTDCVIVYRDTAGFGSTGDWIARTAETAGGNNQFTLTSTETNWQLIRLEFTCSATAGNRKIEVYLNDVLQTTFATDANMPTELLRPFIGCVTSGGGTQRLQCDRITFGFRNIPESP